MAKQSGTKEVTKTALLEAGCRIMRDKGYSNTGIQEVLDSTGVPKGFVSIITLIAKKILPCKSSSTLTKPICLRCWSISKTASLKPLDRLKAYCDQGRRNLIDNNCSKGCLIGNLSQEMSDQSEVLRARLEEVLTAMAQSFCPGY